MFAKNAWYVACTPEEIDGKPLGRRICGQPIAFFRGPEGQVAAVEDFCPHRGAPLSLGYVEEGKLVCGYHGLQMGCDGKTVAMPCQRVRGFPAVKAYPVQERHGFVWVWPGEADKADPETIPVPAWSGRDDWTVGGGIFNIKCDYRLLVDNLMDLTHETFVHKSSIGHEAVANTPLKVTHEGRRVQVERWMHDVDAPPFLDMQLRMARGFEKSPPVDRWQVIHFEAPATIVIDVGVAPTGTGAPDGDRSAGVSGRVMNTVTPKGDGTCYYFFAYGRSFALDNRDLTADIRAANIRIFTEDKVVLEEQQRMMEQLPGRKLVDLSIDAGSLWSRRAITAMIDEERSRADRHASQTVGVAA